MTKQEYLEELCNLLSGQVPSGVVMDTNRYYSNYIDEQIRNGKSEAEVLEELGKPNLIARSIIAAQAGERSADVEYTEDGRTRKVHTKKVYERTESENKEKRPFVFDFNAWYAKVLYLLIFIVLVIFVFFLLKIGIIVLVTFGIPILIALGIFYLIMYFLKS